MKLFIVGSIKINSNSRRKFFLRNLDSLETVKTLFSWDFNIAGKYGELCKKEIEKRYKDAVVTNNDELFYYQIVKNQVSSINGENTLLFFFQEDHWFVCPHKKLFLYLLEEFEKSKSEVLRITHLTDFWAIENKYKFLGGNHLFKEYLIDLPGQENIWKENKADRVTSLPGIFKKSFIDALLENNKDLLSKSKRSKDMELHSQKAVEFLEKRAIITMAPTFHVLREVFCINQDERAMDAKKAFKIIKLRDAQDPAIKSWRRAVRLIMAPRILAGRIKRKIIKP